jgi:AcrR family transcriptional regulator
MYMHYGSKEELFSDLVYIANEEIRDRLRRAVLAAGPEATSQLEAVVRAYVEFHTELPLLATLGHNDLHVLTGRSLERVAAIRKEAVDLLREVIERGNAAGEFRCEDPMLAIAAIAGMGIRIASWYRSPSHANVDGDLYTAEVRRWMPRDLGLEQVQDTFTAYALRLVRSPEGAKDIPRRVPRERSRRGR